MMDLATLAVRFYWISGRTKRLSVICKCKKKTVLAFLSVRKLCHVVFIAFKMIT